ncbi:MAG TPA: DsbA family protein [Solirubrobacteraceae bacterium]|nr:DsbA family protein [Solirubrobacteraceae bacterium]
MTDAGPAFYFDLAAPEAYLVAERILQAMPVATLWVPVLDRDLPGGSTFEGFRCADERDIAMEALERAADAHGLQPIRWPDPLPFDSAFAMRAATFARQIGRAVPFALAAFRQAYAGGRALDLPDNVLIAASACEMHPAAVLRAAELRSVDGALRAATAEAAARGVRATPAVWVAGEAFHGDEAVAAAAEAARGTVRA